MLTIYCLMPNHVHIVLREGKESIESAMKRIGASYVYWYNARYRRAEHLFQDRFKSEPVESDAYLLTVIRYVHWNPVKAGLCSTPEYQALSPEKRDEGLRKLLKKGVSIRQASRITGVSFGIVRKFVTK